MTEKRRCNECGESWVWVEGDDLECPYCGSDDTYVEED